jgi:hypothetical protein
MVAEKNESTRNLLDEIEGDWDTPKPRAAASPEVQAALDAAADRLVDSLDPPPVSVPTMDELDSGWDEEDEDDEEEDEEDEVELPDERLDPVAYAAAKKAREERDEARRQRRRAKAEAKKARRTARLEAQKSKQKGKQKKARAAPKPARPAKEAAKEARRNRARAAAKPALARDEDDTSTDTAGEDDVEATGTPSRSRAKLPPSRPMKKPMLSTTNQWMLAVAVLVFVAAAIFAAVVAR